MAAGAITTRGASARPSHLYEIDMMRVLTALGVVGVHVAVFTAYLNTAPLGMHLQYAAVSALHFTREVFVTITAFVMVYTYTRRPFDVGGFWKRRGLGVVMPYIVWSLVYLLLGVPLQPFGTWVSKALVAIATGTASYQLYYILLTIEIYVVLPIFIPFVKWAGTSHPWRLLAASGLLQVVMFYFVHNYVEAGPLSSTPAAKFFMSVEFVVLPLYQFYAVTGAVVALHMGAVRSFFRRHGALVVSLSLAGLAALWIRFFVAVLVEHQGDWYASSVFQPIIAIYSVASAALIYWFGVKWATAREPAKPWAQGFWSLLSDASFGVYLIHPLFLTVVLNDVLTRLPASVPVALKVVGAWGLVVLLTELACVALLYLPVLCRLIGRPSRWPAQGRPRLATDGRATAKRLDQPTATLQERP